MATIYLGGKSKIRLTLFPLNESETDTDFENGKSTRIEVNDVLWIKIVTPQVDPYRVEQIENSGLIDPAHEYLILNLDGEPGMHPTATFRSSFTSLDIIEIGE